jgi:hypothetical protein
VRVSRPSSGSAPRRRSRGVWVVGSFPLSCEGEGPVCSLDSVVRKSSRSSSKLLRACCCLVVAHSREFTRNFQRQTASHVVLTGPAACAVHPASSRVQADRPARVTPRWAIPADILGGRGGAHGAPHVALPNGSACTNGRWRTPCCSQVRPCAGGPPMMVNNPVDLPLWRLFEAVVTRQGLCSCLLYLPT